MTLQRIDVDSRPVPLGLTIAYEHEHKIVQDETVTQDGRGRNGKHRKTTERHEQLVIRILELDAGATNDPLRVAVEHSLAMTAFDFEMLDGSTYDSLLYSKRPQQPLPSSRKHYLVAAPPADSQILSVTRADGGTVPEDEKDSLLRRIEQHRRLDTLDLALPSGTYPVGGALDVLSEPLCNLLPGPLEGKVVIRRIESPPEGPRIHAGLRIESAQPDGPGEQVSEYEGELVLRGGDGWPHALSLRGTRRDTKPFGTMRDVRQSKSQVEMTMSWRYEEPAGP